MWLLNEILFLEKMRQLVLRWVFGSGSEGETKLDSQWKAKQQLLKGGGSAQ